MSGEVGVPKPPVKGADPATAAERILAGRYTPIGTESARAIQCADDALMVASALARADERITALEAAATDVLHWLNPPCTNADCSSSLHDWHEARDRLRDALGGSGR